MIIDTRSIATHKKATADSLRDDFHAGARPTVKYVFHEDKFAIYSASGVLVRHDNKEPYLFDSVGEAADYLGNADMPVFAVDMTN